MKIPVIQGTIDRRILVNYRIDADVAARFLPPPFQPKLVAGMAVGGICLIRLRHIRPRFAPPFFGLHSENAAHRFAVVWESGGELREGVYIPRRDTSSRLNSLVGGRLFPGVHHHARFEIHECNDRYAVRMTSDDGDAHVFVDGRVVDRLPSGSVFRSVHEASEFFERGSVGYSGTQTQGVFEGLELRTFCWEMRPLRVERVHSSLFANRVFFPAGSAQFDSALLMRGIAHEWHSKEPLCASAPQSADAVWV